jgi:CheY-like chemotaxis protein
MDMDKKIRILIVEDEYLIAFSFKRELERMGYEVLEPIAHGQEAIKVATREHPDFVIMDMGLAGPINGLEAARQIITQQNIPVIFMTGHSDDKTLEQIQALKPVACLIKPIVGMQIHVAIKKHIQDIRP